MYKCLRYRSTAPEKTQEKKNTHQRETYTPPPAQYIYQVDRGNVTRHSIGSLNPRGRYEVKLG